MIVYPPGCVIVEKLVLGLAHIMNSKGINVLVDILQSQRMAEEGKANVLKSDFEIADYVVILCTEPESKIFNFLKKNLILEFFNFAFLIIIVILLFFVFF